MIQITLFCFFFLNFLMVSFLFEYFLFTFCKSKQLPNLMTNIQQVGTDAKPWFDVYYVFLSLHVYANLLTA